MAIKIKEFVKEVLEDNKKSNIGDNYCVIVWTYSHLYPEKRISFIYKNIEEFNKKAGNDIRQIDEMFSIDFETKIFD